MTNQSIKNAFQRFWEYVVLKVDGKQDIITGTQGQFVIIGDDGNVTTGDKQIDYNALANKPSNATSSVSGFMSSTDKTKLDSYAPTAIIISTSTTNLPTVVNGAILVAYDG